MAWIKLSDDYCDHPKFDNLSDGAFRLWHQAMGFCRKYQTDGLVPTASLKKFKAYSPKRGRELETPWTKDEQPLWQHVEGFGILVYNYLKWNPSKEEENERKGESKERMRHLRDERRSPSGALSVRANSERTSGSCSHDVLGGIGEGKDLVLLEERRSATRQHFDAFWRVYPRKVGKDAAWRVWQRRNPSEDTTQIILGALAWQKQQDNWLREGGRFVPNPATWINQGRWQDEPQDTPHINGHTLAAARAVEEFLK